MKKLTLRVIRKWFKDNDIQLRHDIHAIKWAINELNKEVETDAYDLFELVVSNRPINSLYTHSYGFHTRGGRYLIDTFSYLYHKYNSNNN
tara:strand:- start:830 stop:1099 length:270 start_codon:yes stop_codon:yes gene_type:complete